MDLQQEIWRAGEPVSILMPAGEDSAVKNAAAHLAQDVEKVCGCCPESVFVESGQELFELSKRPGLVLIIGTAGNHKILGSLPQWQQAGLSNFFETEEAHSWERYVQTWWDRLLFLLGADRRGTVYSIYEFSQFLGVSPWYYWADVPVRKRESISLPMRFFKTDKPSVQYRGIFINDEEELEAWAKKHTGDGTIGPETYERIYELILRLKGNYLWPAMHVNYFNENPENGRLANEMGIVIGTSHCDMLLRSNQNEWKPWLEKKKYTGVHYDYSLPGRNREILKEYWKESVEQNRDYEVCYTVGMRGVHDSGFQTEEIDSDPDLTEEEKVKARVELLGKVIRDQREILKEVLGKSRGEKALQTFIPYKEVLPLYDRGLDLPGDITTIWVDDNFGHMRRYPDESERKRSGGHGLYYHVSYWAAPGMSYLFINSIPLAQIKNELEKSFDSGIRRMWILNVGALKPLEQEIDFYFNLAWEVGKGTGITCDVREYTAFWINRNFSGGHGDRVSGLYEDFARLTNLCKVEHLHSDAFSQSAYGNEALERLRQLQEIYEEGVQIYRQLPEEERSSFFQMFLMKVTASYLINASFFYGDRSRKAYETGAMQSADRALFLSLQMDRRKRQLIHYYNFVLEKGKWEGILTPESFSPPPTALYPAGKPALVIGDPALGVSGEIVFTRYGSKEHSLEIFNRGCGSVGFYLTFPEWLTVTPMQGRVRTECVVRVHFNKERTDLFREGGSGWIEVLGDEGTVEKIPVLVRKGKEAPARQEKMTMEGDGYCSFLAGDYSRSRGETDFFWKVIPGLGRGVGDAVQAVSLLHRPWDGDVKKAPCLEYDFLLESSGAFLLEIYRFLTLNSTGTLRFAIGVDGDTPVVLQSDTTDEWRGNWRSAVMNNGEKLYLHLPRLEAGEHVLKVYMLDPYLTFTKFVIYTRDREESNLGPMSGQKWTWRENPYEEVGKADFDLPFFQTDPPLLPMLYADRDFRKRDTLYTPAQSEEQEPGPLRYQPDRDGRKNVFLEFGEGYMEEKDGRVAFEAEYALENSRYAFLTGAGEEVWTHTQAETDGGSGLAMYLDFPDRFYPDSRSAPGMHYRIRIFTPGRYHLWLLVKFDDDRSDSCKILVDGETRDLKEGNLFTYSMKQRWNWQLICDLDLSAGCHLFSILGRKSGLRIDRIYLTLGEERPPHDREWREWERRAL